MSLPEKSHFNPHLYTLGNTDGHDLRLSSKESEVLELLCQHQATTVTRQFLFEHAWPNGSGTDGHLNRIILLLRRKFDVLGEVDAIKTVPKVGYILADAVAFIESLEENTVEVNAAVSQKYILNSIVFMILNIISSIILMEIIL